MHLCLNNNNTVYIKKAFQNRMELELEADHCGIDVTRDISMRYCTWLAVLSRVVVSYTEQPTRGSLVEE